MLIRLEEPTDFAQVFAVNAATFKTSAEAELVDVLRIDAQLVISLVAENEGVIVGHILFSPVRLTGHEELRIMGLAPMAVMPQFQSRGFGSGLVKAGLEACREKGYGAVVLLGHTWFYPRFGFTPSVNYGIRSEYDVTAEAFMVLELKPGYLRGATGVIQYHPAFKDV
jgi:putative acetyltransferase